jgi:hypothetical protein
LTDEKFFALIVACIGFLVGVIAMGLLGKAFGGTAEEVMRVGGLAVGLVIGLTLWRRIA